MPLVVAGVPAETQIKSTDQPHFLKILSFISILTVSTLLKLLPTIALLIYLQFNPPITAPPFPPHKIKTKS